MAAAVDEISNQRRALTVMGERDAVFGGLKNMQFRLPDTLMCAYRYFDRQERTRVSMQNELWRANPASVLVMFTPISISTRRTVTTGEVFTCTWLNQSYWASVIAPG